MNSYSKSCQRKCIAHLILSGNYKDGWQSLNFHKLKIDYKNTFFPNFPTTTHPSERIVIADGQRCLRKSFGYRKHDLLESFDFALRCGFLINFSEQSNCRLTIFITFQTQSAFSNSLIKFEFCVAPKKRTRVKFFSENKSEI